LSTLPPLNLTTVNSIVPRVFDCKGAKSFQITISPPSSGTSSGVYLAFARSYNGLTGGFDSEEFHGFELLTINDESVDAIQYRIAVAGGSAILTIIPGS
jgi:hypothetical protein